MLATTLEKFMQEIPTYHFTLMPGITDTQYFPTQATPKATGWDVRSSETMTIQPGQYVKIPLGVRGFCPEGWWYEIKPRSSTFVKKNLHALYGTIDEDYEGQLVFAAQYIPELTIIKDMINSFKIKPTHSFLSEFIKSAKEHIAKYPSLNLQINAGDAVAQIIPIKRQMMTVAQNTNEELDLLYKERGDARGAGGFGSTDKK